MSTSIERRASNLIPLLNAATDAAQEEERDGDAALFAAAADVLRSMITAANHDDPADDVPAPPPKREAPAKAASSSTTSGHRHKFDDAGHCVVKRDGQPCAAVRQRTRGDKKPPEPAPTAADVHTQAIKAAMTRHFRTVSGSGATAALCAAPLGPLDALTTDVQAVNCLDCNRRLDARGATL